MDFKKDIIRKNILAIRNLIDENEQINKSKEIFNTVTGLIEYSNCKTIMCYVDFRGEVITKDIINLSLKLNKTVCVPKVYKDMGGNQEILASIIKDPEIELSKGKFGILEPSAEYLRRIDAEEIDMVIVPGIAFDTRRNRIGFGAGFYDKFFKRVRSNCFKAALAYEFQIVEEIPADSFDIPMDLIITEERKI
ncbi:MAG: 5-formyltetrahydrofolate cyclo-ligase [Bacillota bacterium]|nr:5-formyltetrahydrofolate cyclo-ligase [Bacillota bacterium]